MEDDRASEMAGNFSLALTVPMVAMDRLQAGGMSKLPFFEAAMKKTAERIVDGVSPRISTQEGADRGMLNCED